MGNLRLYGSTSGYVEIAPPAVGGSQVLTLPTDSIQPGMVLVNKTDFSASSSVSVNNCFTSTYDNYRILISSTGSTLLGLRFRLRAAGSDISSANSYRRADIYQSASATINGVNDLGTEANIGTIQSNVTSLHALDINQPLLASWKTLIGRSVTDDYFNNFGITLRTTTAADGFSIYGSTGTLTGTIRIYGYRNS